MSTVIVGDCADPRSDGVLGPSASLDRADRDLDGDRVAELVSVDRSMCTADGNCYWNLFSTKGRSGCHRYLGTVAGTAIERLAERGDDGFHDLRVWWTLTGRGRVLLQQYRFRQGGYRVVDALVCRMEKDDRLVCADDQR